jgi:hypothetical protein
MRQAQGFSYTHIIKLCGRRCGRGSPLSAFVFAFCIVALFLAKNLSDISGCIFFIVCSLFLAYMVHGAALATSSIIVDDVGISGFAFGKIWRTIQWSKVTRVRVKSFVDPIRSYGGPRIKILYMFDQTQKPRWVTRKDGWLIFSNEIGELPVLLDIINTNIKKHNIEVLDCSKSEKRCLNALMS